MTVLENTPVGILSIQDLAYIAGFIDGDGSICAQIIVRTDYVLRFQIYLTVNVTQKNRRKYILEKLRKIWGKGIVRDRGDGNSEWALNGFAHVGPFLTQILPYLRLKKKQANLVLKIIEQHPLVQNDPQKFVNLCYLADQLSVLNDSKNPVHTTETVLAKYAEIFPDIQFQKRTKRHCVRATDPLKSKGSQK